MIIAQLTTDNREPFRQYDLAEPWFGTAPEALLQGFESLPEIEVHVVSCTQQPMSRSPEKLAPNIWFHSLHVPKLGWMRTAYQGCIRAIRRKVREITPDIVHGQGTERDCAISAVYSGFPNVVTIHGNMSAIARHETSAFAKVYARSAALLEAATLRQTSGVFCNSAYTEAIVSRSARVTWRVPNPLRSRFFDPLPVSSTIVPVILNIGVVSPRKRQLELLDVAHRLHVAGCKFQLQFVGKLDAHSPYGSLFAERMAHAEAAGFAKYLGPLPESELIALLDKSSALAHVPSEEAFGLVVAEALARNLKVFAADVGGLTEIASGVDRAALFPNPPWEALAEAMQEWLHAGAPRPKAAAGAMAARYHPKVIAQRHIEIYREVLSNRK